MIKKGLTVDRQTALTSSNVTSLFCATFLNQISKSSKGFFDGKFSSSRNGSSSLRYGFRRSKIKRILIQIDASYFDVFV